MKPSKDNQKLLDSIESFEHALSFQKKIKEDSFYFLGLAKAYEICLEYCWKYFKKTAEDEGLEAFSPREAIKLAGRLEIIDSVESWLRFLEIRNRAVHDYIGVPSDEYLKTINEFHKELKKLKPRGRS